MPVMSSAPDTIRINVVLGGDMQTISRHLFSVIGNDLSFQVLRTFRCDLPEVSTCAFQGSIVVRVGNGTSHDIN